MPDCLTINTDDPAMQDLDLGREYRRVAAAYAWDINDMGMLALEGIESTWLDAPDRVALTREFEGASRAADRPAPDPGQATAGRRARYPPVGRDRLEDERLDRAAVDGALDVVEERTVDRAARG
jgi:hypothetical protein